MACTYHSTHCDYSDSKLTDFSDIDLKDNTNTRKPVRNRQVQQTMPQRHLNLALPASASRRLLAKFATNISVTNTCTIIGDRFHDLLYDLSQLRHCVLRHLLQAILQQILPPRHLNHALRRALSPKASAAPQEAQEQPTSSGSEQKWTKMAPGNYRQRFPASSLLHLRLQEAS